MNDQLLTVEEVAYRLNVSEQTVRKLIRTHQLLALRFGRNYRVSEQTLNEFIINKQG